MKKEEIGQFTKNSLRARRVVSMEGAAMATVLLLVASLQVSLAVDIPEHVPNVWGGTTYGLMAPYMGHSSHLFAFSGADGETQEGSGFTGLLLPELYAVNLFVFNRGSDLQSHTLKLSIGDGPANGTLVAASSDTIVIESQTAVSELVLTYSAWNVLIGYSPVVSLTSDNSSLTSLDELGCTSTGRSMALCKGKDNVFAVAYGEGNATDIAAAALKAHGSRDMVDAVASTRLAALATLPTRKCYSCWVGCSLLQLFAFKLAAFPALVVLQVCGSKLVLMLVYKTLVQY